MTSPAAIFRGKTRKQEKKQKRLERRERVGELRRAVFDRAAGRCERCGREPPVHLHHTLGGSGRRRQLESVENCVAVCLSCHAKEHHL